MIEIFDNIVPLNIRNWVYNLAVNSNYRIMGWADRDDLELKNKHNLHTRWNLQDLQNSKIIPYVEQVLKQSSYKDYTMKDFDLCIINAVKPHDYHYTHAHPKGTISILYYINLEWQHNWAGETIFYEENMKEVQRTSSYVPGRFVLFEDEPHTIRSQSAIGPAWRFTMGLFLKKKKV